ncbi:MAG TPA: class I SAM-dependent methyltransferase, partial [Solirubrobacteraceae bacterium]
IRYLRHHLDLLQLGGADPDRRVVVDAGCGFGFTMILDALLGATRVHGIEVNRSMVQTIETFLPLLPDEVASRVEVHCASVTKMPLEDESADIVLSVEAISHYLHVEEFIDEAFRVLRPGGVLLIADGNNGSNPIVRRHTYEIWEAAERGQADQTVRGHLLGEPYVEVRRQVLQTNFPEMSAPAAAEIARRTAGFTADRVIAAGRDYLEHSALPSSIYRRRKLAVAPDGTAMEELFHPGRLARQLRQRGFQARAYGYWGGANGSALIRSVNRALTALSPVTMPTAPSFRVVARKPAAPVAPPELESDRNERPER